MKTSTYHATNLGRFAPRQHADCNGYRFPLLATPKIDGFREAWDR